MVIASLYFQPSLHPSKIVLIFTYVAITMYVHIIVVITCRGRAVTNVGRTCGPTPLLAIYAIKYVYTNLVNRSCINSIAHLRGRQKENTVKFLNFRTPENIALITLKFEQIGLTAENCLQKMQME